MPPHASNRNDFLQELESLRVKLAEADQTLRAIRDAGADLGGEEWILEHVAEAVVVCDRGLRIARANAKARRLCGQDPAGELFDAAFSLKFRGEQQVDVRVLLMHVMAGRAMQKFEAALSDAQGADMDLVLSAEPLRGQEQRIVGCVLTLTDITLQKRAQEESRRAKEQAEAANQGKDDFLATLSHELRTPLSPVLMSVSALEGRGDLPAVVQGELSMIRRNVELEARLIDDLLDLTRIGRGKLELDFQVVDAGALLRQAAAVFAGEAEAKHLQFTVHAEEGRYYLRADAARLQQVFWNLIKNAIKFTPPSGRIVTRCFCNERGNVVVEVKDTGIGIEPAMLPRLFAPFEQGGREMTRRFGGLGLGLAISQGLVKLHGGVLAAWSEGRGRGATFTVDLPAQAAPERQAEPVKQAPVEAQGRTEQHLRILVVEDHQDTARTMAHLLESYGHEAYVAGGVRTAMELAEQLRFDLVIGDLGLPDGNGLELMGELKRRYDLPGIVVSGYGMQEDIEKSRRAGYPQHLIKPINAQQLEATIRSLMQRGLPGGRAEADWG